MATGRFSGNASFTYLPTGESTPEVHVLALALKELEIVDIRQRSQFWSADYSTRSIVNIGNGADEILATIRCDDEPQKLRTMLREALDNDATLSYQQLSMASPIEFKLVEIVGDQGAIILKPDRDRYAYGEWEVRVRLRRSGGAAISELL